MSYQAPRGTQDILPSDIAKWHYIEELIRQFCHVYNYQEIRTPLFEHTNVFKRGNDASDMVNKEMYTFQLQNSDTSLTLRPEGTAGVVRSFIEHKVFGNPDLPSKVYYVGPQCRHERPQKGRMRIFHQFGVEVIGAKSPLLDVETIVLGWSFISTLGLKDIKVVVNTLGDDTSRTNYRKALQEYFKNDIDTMCADCKRRYDQNPLRILDCKIDHDHRVMKDVPKIEAYLNEESRLYFQEVLDGLDVLGIPYEVDDRLVRGLDYYSHTVFEVVSVNTKMGAQSTVFAGGRYDGLVEYFGGPQGMSGIGWAMGLERLLIACEGEGIQLGEEADLDAYVLCLSPNVKNIALQIVTQLRANGYRSDMDYMQRSFKAQFKTVERKKARVAILVGEKDVEHGTLTIKDILHQTQMVVPMEDVIIGMDELFNQDAKEHECTCNHTDCTCSQEHE